MNSRRLMKGPDAGAISVRPPSFPTGMNKVVGKSGHWRQNDRDSNNIRPCRWMLLRSFREYSVAIGGRDFGYVHGLHLSADAW